MYIKIKNTSYYNLNIFIILSLALILVLIFHLTGQSWQVMASFTAARITFSIGVFQSRLAHDRMFRELFTEFDQRYDRMNNDLQHILHAKTLQTGDRQRIVDYFNLCAEEYYWFRKSRIPADIWEAWRAGMKYYKDQPLFRQVAQEEKEYDVSYYGFFESIWDKPVVRLKVSDTN